MSTTTMNETIGNSIVSLVSVDSTNNYANKELLTKRPVHGIVYSADFQTGGRGQRGNGWESAAGMNLTFSTTVIPDNILASDQFLISKAVSLAVASFYDKYVDDVCIKWPNDIYVGNKKIAGILIESQLKSMEVAISVIGIGMNLNQEQFESGAPNPVSLFHLTGEKIDRSFALKQICEELNSWINCLYTDENLVNRTYLDRLYKRGEWNEFTDEKGSYEGMIVDISEYGQLIIEDKKGESHVYNFKEVKYTIPGNHEIY